MGFYNYQFMTQQKQLAERMIHYDDDDDDDDDDDEDFPPSGLKMRIEKEKAKQTYLFRC